MSVRGSGHVHPEYSTESDVHRMEDRINARLDKHDARMSVFESRMTLLVGGLGLVAFLVPIIVPFLREFLNIP